MTCILTLIFSTVLRTSIMFNMRNNNMEMYKVIMKIHMVLASADSKSSKEDFFFPALRDGSHGLAGTSCAKWPEETAERCPRWTACNPQKVKRRLRHSPGFTHYSSEQGAQALLWTRVGGCFIPTHLQKMKGYKSAPFYIISTTTLC